jgi:hypothetical protein
VTICTDVARERILLELREHRPTQHVGQEDVERDRRRQVLSREHERFSPRRDDALEAAFARHSSSTRVVRRPRR